MTTDLHRVVARLERVGAGLRQAAAELRKHHNAATDAAERAVFHRLHLVVSEVSAEILRDLALRAVAP